MKRQLICLVTVLFLVQTQAQDYQKIKISTDIELIKISENAYVHVTFGSLQGYGRFGSNGLIYVDKGKAFLFDTPITDSLTRELVTWLRDSLQINIVGFVPNHWHNDCTGGLGYLKSIGVETWANQRTIDIAKSKGLPVPEHGFTDSLTLKLNDRTIKCYYFGPAHSRDNIVVWLPEEKILFPGCMVKEMNSQNLGNTADGDLNEYAGTIHKVINKFPTARIVIPGHGQIGGMELLRHTKELAE
ncbi:MAG TPA: subclass B1 metallo-beta-lactamase [Bacteroidales bacterium]|nr:subclass B1 metallo-beta-lactamase [Bacteroidales bacterium]